MSQGVSAATYRLPFLPSASDAFRQSVVRILNHSSEAGDVAVTAIDDAGTSFGPVILEIQAQQAIHFSTANLELGNADNGIATGIGGGQGDWRLVLETDLPIEALAYVHTPEGFVDGLNRTVPRRSFYHRVPLLAPSAEFANGGRLRLINGSDSDAEVYLFAIDDTGRLAPGQLSVVLPAGGARSFNARELEQGAFDLAGRLGDGPGDWRLLVFTDGTIEVMALLDHPSGPLANLSASAVTGGDIPYLPAAGDPLRQGSLRVAGRSGGEQLRIRAADDAGRSHGPVTLILDAGRTVNLDSHDLEQGSAAEGLPFGVGDGEGDWRIRLDGEPGLDVVSYLRTPDGFLTSTGGDAAQADRRHYVPWFNPAGDTGSSSRLRLVNPSEDESAEVTIVAWDDQGATAPGGVVGLTLPAGAARSVDAGSLENGARGLSGMFGQGEGKWRLAVKSTRDIRVLNLVESAAGHLTNFGTSPTLDHFPDVCFDGADADGDGLSDECEDGLPTVLFRVGRCADGRYVDAPDANPGLVGDCQALVGIANGWARDGVLPDDHALHRWGAGEQEKLTAWEGVEVDGGRIVGIHLQGSRAEPGELGGAVPPEFGRLTGLTSLDLSYNRFTGPIPGTLAELTGLKRLDLSHNRLDGAIPAELGNLLELEELNLDGNRLSGTVPWVFRERAEQNGLVMHYAGNAIVGLEAPPQRHAPPMFSNIPANNGNASHHSVAYYQGPLVWEWNWLDEPVQRQQPVLGRWAVLAVRVEHEVPEPPPVVTRVLDGEDRVLAASLAEAAPFSTVSTAPGRWLTEYLFDLPGELYRAGHRIVHVIDPDNAMPETDETDNVGEPIDLYGAQAPRLRITFIPVYFPGQEPPALHADLLMRGIRAYWPVADEFEATIAAPFKSDAANQYRLLNDLRAMWNAEADPEEFYYGVFAQPWTGGRGVAYRPGRVAVSELSEFNTIPHEFGHNLGLRHPRGCEATINTDRRYPYPDGALGPVPGWDANWRRLVSGADEAYADVMSYCGRLQSVSDYNYRKAWFSWRSSVSDAQSSAAWRLVYRGSGPGLGPASANGLPPGVPAVQSTAEGPGGLALSGRIDSAGRWSLTHVQRTARGPRPPAPGGTFTLLLYDEEGRELYREPLTADPVSEGDEAGWAVRVPLPPRPATQVVIVDAEGAVVLLRALEAPE